jgi:NAD(P)-dependent dehydrogenase (short-subunit alcohol dehydrogenase family)
MQEAAKRMTNNGRIINMETSLVGATTPYYSAYAGSKAPREDFTRALAKEIENRGITVNNIAPGPLNTSFFYPAETSESTEYFKGQSVKGRLGEITDIVPLAKFSFTGSRLGNCTDNLHQRRISDEIAQIYTSIR